MSKGGYSTFFGVPNSSGIGAGLLHPLSGSAPSHLSWGFIGDRIVLGFDWRYVEVVGWKSSSLTMVGVRKIMRLSFDIDLDSLWNAQPNPGMSPNNGTLEYVAVGLSCTRPPMTSVLPLGIITWD